jgi:hypothetical protein
MSETRRQRISSIHRSRILACGGVLTRIACIECRPFPDWNAGAVVVFVDASGPGQSRPILQLTIYGPSVVWVGRAQFNVLLMRELPSGIVLEIEIEPLEDAP